MIGAGDVENRHVSFVYAAYNEERGAFTTVAVDGQGEVIHAASVRTRPEMAEQAAIAVALLNEPQYNIYSDSRSAIRAFERGAVYKVASRILSLGKVALHFLYWFPAYLGTLMDQS